MNDQSTEELLQLEKDFQRAIVENNAEQIGRYVADDWIIVDADNIGAINRCLRKSRRSMALRTYAAYSNPC